MNEYELINALQKTKRKLNHDDDEDDDESWNRYLEVYIFSFGNADTGIVVGS